MDAKKGGQTESPQAVDVTDEASLADVLKQTLELEEVPQNETPEEAEAEAADDKGTDSEVLSQTDEGETEAEAEPAADESDDDTEETGEEKADNDAGEADPPHGVQKRINKLTKRVKERDEQIADLQGKLDEAEESPNDPPPAAAPRADNPFTEVTTLKDIEREEHNAEAILDWCDDNEDGAFIKSKDGEIEYTSDEVRDARKRASKALRKWLPDRKRWIGEHVQQKEYAEQTYRWWKDKSSSEFQAAQSLLREFPELQRFPDYQVIVGDTLQGMMMRLSAEQTKKPTGGKPKKAPKQPTAPTAEPAPVEPSTARSSSARQSFGESGNVEDLAQVLAADFLS